MANLTTFERAQAPAAPEAPEPHTPGPFVRHGVMVRDTLETTGGMFCIRQAVAVTTNAGKAAVIPGEMLGYAYSRPDADLFAASAAMLAALVAALPHVAQIASQQPTTEARMARVRAAASAHSQIQAAIAAAEGRA